MVVLMRERDAIARGARVYAHLAGWGMSTDGRGGITRPEVDGIRLALNRAYERAGYGLETVGYVEGHGTGTEVGDAVELRALSSARHDVAPDAPAVPLSTIKGNIGHTKAAAGVAGLIKASLAIHHQVIPPATSHVETHPELERPEARVRVPQAAELWPDGLPIRASVSSSGFGGINTHLTMEGDGGERRRG